MGMIVNKLSSSQFEITLDWDVISLKFLLTRNESRRTAHISFSEIKGTSDVTQDVTCSIKCNNSSGKLLKILDNKFSVSRIRSGVSLSYTNSYDTVYYPSGCLDLILDVEFLPYNTSHEDFSLYEDESFNIEKLYEPPTINISSVTGTHKYNNTTYVNLGDIINFTISQNSENNDCDPNKSFIGLEYRKAGLPTIVEKYKSIDDEGGRKTITPNISESNYEKYDGSEISIYAVREDNKGTKVTSTFYLGYFYIFPRLMNSKLEVYSETNEDLKYDIKNESGVCLLLGTNNTVKFNLSFDEVLGRLASMIINVRRTSDGKMIISDIADISSNGYSSTYTTSELKLDKSEEYIVTFIPAMYKNYLNNSQAVTSKLFKLLNYVEYSFTGPDDKPLDPNSSLFSPVNPNIHFITSDGKDINANTTVKLTKETAITKSELHSSISDCIVRPAILCYRSLNKILNDTIVYCMFTRLDTPKYNFNLITEGATYKNILEKFNIDNSVNNKFYLMHEVSVRTKGGEMHNFYQYIARLHYVPEVYSENIITVRSNNYSISVTFDPTNYYVDHQNGIINKYGFKMKYGSIVYYEGFSDTNTITFSIPEQVESWRNYTFTVDLYYSETINKETTDYKYSSDNISFKTKINKFEITDKPEIIYPTVDEENSYYCYSYYNNPYFLIYIQLPKILDGTSETPERGDAVYSNINISINGTVYLYSNYTDLFIGNFAYLERMVFIVDASRLKLKAANEYNIKISVRQDYGGISKYGEPAEITVSGFKLKSAEKRSEDDYNGVIKYDQYKTIYDVMAGFCKSYSAYSSSVDPPTIINNYKKGIGQLIESSDFNEVCNCVKRTIVDVNSWLNEITTSTEKLIEDEIEFKANPGTLILKDKSQNYIEQMYDWIKFIYNQIEYEPEENFITINNSDNVSCTIIRYIGNSKSVIIPPTIRSKTVTIIESTAFSYNDSITKVVIPNTVTTIN